MKKKSWLKSPWTITTGGVLLGFILPLLRDFIKSLPRLSSLKSLFTALVKYTVLFLNLNIKVWWIISFLIVVIFVLFLVGKLQNSSPPSDMVPDFYSYNSDKLKKWKWSWVWKFSAYTNSWVVENLTAHCPECDTPLIAECNRLREDRFVCPRCDYSSISDQHIEDPFKIKRIIIDNANRKNYV